MDLGEKLYELRKSKNLTQDDVAEKINVTRQTVSKWETNQSVPDFDKIVPLCDLFEISTDELLKGKSEEDGDDEKFDLNEAKKHLFERAKENKIDYEHMTAGQIKQKSAEVVSSSILLFILSFGVFPLGVSGLKINPVICLIVFLLLIGIGVSRIVKHYMSIPDVEKTEEEKKQDKIEKEISDIVMGITVALYFIVSFSTMAWHITWIMFIIGGIIARIVNLIFSLKGGNGNEE